MKKTKILLPIIVSCALVGTVIGAVAVSNNQNNIETFAYSSGQVKDPFVDPVFYVDEKVSLSPKDIVYEGHLITSYDYYLIYPDMSQKFGSEHRLSQTGEYTIVYLGKLDTKIIKAEEHIYAYNKAYTVTKESSSTTYVDSIKGNQTKTPGISVSLAEADTWTFNQAIDISKADLTKPIITYYTRQMSELHEHMSCDVDTVVVRLTDYYDPTNYVEVRNTYNCTNNSTGRLQPYVLANANGQTPAGIDPSNRSSRTINYNGSTYYLHTGKAWGACLDTVPGVNGIFGQKYNPDIANSDNRGYSLYYNYAESSIHMHHRDMHVVTDLDEPAIYSNNLFKGFTTGEVIVSMSCETYNESLAVFEISEIFGIKGEDLNRKYSYDENAPIITLSNNANNFKIAKGEEFTIFNAIASDPNLIGEVTSEVFYDYGTTNERYIPLKDGKFVPTFVGKYTIKYTAKDLYGNVAEKFVTCDAINTANNKIVELEFNAPTTVDAGTYLTIDVPKVKGYNEGIYAEAILTYKGDDSLVEEIDLDNPTILIKRVGNYELSILYGDVATGRIERFPIVSNATQNAYLEKTNFPKYFIKGTKTSLDENKTILCDSEAVHYVDHLVYVNEDDQGYGETAINPRDFTVNASNSVQFKYVYEGKTVYESNKIQVCDVNFVNGIDMSKYFIGNMDINAQSDCINFTAKNDGSNQEVEFINPLSFNLLRLDLSFDAKSTSLFKKFTITLSDYYGKDETFDMVFYYVANSLNVQIDGKNAEVGVTNTISISYDSINKSIGFGNGLFLNRDNPFSNDKFYLSFKFEGLSDDVKFSVKSINNQNLNSDNFDFFAPQISYSRLKGQRHINDEVVISKSSAVDVLSPYLFSEHKLIVTYKDSTGATSTVSSIDGVLLDGSENPNVDYRVKLDKFGTYTITYKYCDQAYSFGELNPNKLTVSEVVYVNDNEAPVIYVKDVDASTIENAKLDSEITVHDYTVSDNSETTVTIYAFSPMGGIVKVTDKKFKVNYEGDWRVVYYAIDANNNVSSFSYIVRVTK